AVRRGGRTRKAAPGERIGRRSRYSWITRADMPTLPQSPIRRNPPRKPPAGVQGRTFALVRELRLLIETTRALASAHEPKSVLRVIFDKAKAFVRATRFVTRSVICVPIFSR